jgi:hypothetical protein
MTIAVIGALAALLCSVGADAHWLAALGRSIAPHLSIPAGVPFAAAPSAHWPNALVAGELAFDWLEEVGGDRALMVAQLLALMFGLAVLARDALREGATPDGAAGALALVAIGALPSLVIVRVQLFSLALFPLLAALLRSESRHRSRRIWLVVPLLALWGNLHGAALVGLLVTLAYLLLCRLRQDPLTTVVLALASALALCLTPALTDTVTYYRGVLTNVAAQRGVGLWVPLSLDSPFDDLAIAAALLLGFFALRTRSRLWEVAVVIGLGLLSIRTGRSAVWLLYFLAVPAARSIRARLQWGYLSPLVVVAALATIAVALVRGPVSSKAEARLISRAVALARGTPVLAPDKIAEQVALDGGRIWLGNPLDAFSARDQGVYLDWSAGRAAGAAALAPAVRVVLVERGSAAERLTKAAGNFKPLAAGGSAVLYQRVGWPQENSVFSVSTAGNRSTMNIDGKIRNTSGKSIFTGAF